MNSSNAHLYLPFVQALVDGKTIQLKGAGWNDCKDTDFKWSPDLYRIKPWTLTRHLPGFRPLRDGEEWHRQDFTEEMLPDGWRPLLLQEQQERGDEEYWEREGWSEPRDLTKAYKSLVRMRTRRPLPEPPKPVPLEPADWMKDGPWWFSTKNHKFPRMVTGVDGDSIDYGIGSVTHERAMDYDRSNDGMHWYPCSKLP